MVVLTEISLITANSHMACTKLWHGIKVYNYFVHDIFIMLCTQQHETPFSSKEHVLLHPAIYEHGSRDLSCPYPSTDNKSFFNKNPTNALTVYVNTTVFTLLHSYMFRLSVVTFREHWYPFLKCINTPRWCRSVIKKNSVALVCTQTIPTERPPPVGEVSANFCG